MSHTLVMIPCRSAAPSGAPTRAARFASYTQPHRTARAVKWDTAARDLDPDAGRVQRDASRCRCGRRWRPTSMGEQVLPQAGRRAPRVTGRACGRSEAHRAHDPPRGEDPVVTSPRSRADACERAEVHPSTNRRRSIRRCGQLRALPRVRDPRSGGNYFTTPHKPCRQRISVRIPGVPACFLQSISET